MEASADPGACDDNRGETDAGDQPSKGSSTTWEYPLTDDNDVRSDHTNEDNNNVQADSPDRQIATPRGHGGRPRKEGDSMRLNIVINSSDQSLAEQFIGDKNNRRRAGPGREDGEEEATAMRKQSLTAGKKRKRKKKAGKARAVEPPPVEKGEVLVPVHSVWHRNRRVGAGHVVKKGDQVLRYIDRKGTVYRPKDSIYLENKQPDQPFYICSIQQFKLTKRDTLLMNIKWYFRLSEIPSSVSHHLLLDRHIEHGCGESVIKDPAVKSRELFTSDASDTVPITALRGKCQVVHYQDIRSARAFKPAPDVFFYVLGYNPQTKRLATTQGEIRVGSSHQARLPECKPHVQPAEMPERCDSHEEIKWRPLHVMDGDLIMYLRAARSIAAFAGMCDGGSADDGCQAASMDETTMNAMDILHRNSYDTGKALQALVKSPAMKTIEKKWTDEDSKRFVKGLRQYGKNFFKIRKELLPHRETGELIEYYYFWKKTPSAVSNRPHRRHRRQGGLKRQNTRSSSQPSEYLDQSSATECSDDSEDSDGGRDLSSYLCRHCFTTVSKDWHHAGKDRTLLCTKCRLFFKKYGEERPLDGEKEPPPFLFKPVKEEEEESINGKHNMRTRRSTTSGDNKSKKSERQSTSSPDIEGPTGKLGRKSPSGASTGSCSSNDKDASKDRLGGQAKTDSKSRKRLVASDTEGKPKRRKDQDRSDSESMLDSSEASGNEELGNEADSDDNNQDDLSASSQPSTPSSLDTEFKATKDYLKPEPLAQSPLVGLPHSLSVSTAAGTATLTSSTTTTTSAVCTSTVVVNPVPSSQDSNSGLILGGVGTSSHITSSLSNSFSPVVTTQAAGLGAENKQSLGVGLSHLAGNLSLPSRQPSELPPTAASTVNIESAAVSSLASQVPSTVSAQSAASMPSSSSSSSFASSSSSSSSSSSPLVVPGATMTSMSSTGVTLMSSGSGTSGEGEKKYLPPQQPQPLSALGGHLFAPYHHHPYYPYAPHLGPRISGPPPPVPSLVPIKKEPGSPLRPDERMKEGEEPHPVIRPHPQSMSSSSASSSLPSLVPDQKLPPPHIPVPPPLTSIDSATGSGLDHGGLVGPESLRDNSREAILREARETPLLGSSSGSGVGGASGVGGPEPSQRTLLPPPLTSLSASATATSTSYAAGLTGSIPHHLSVSTNVMHSDKGPHLEQHGGLDSVRQEGGIPPSLRHSKPESEAVVEEVEDSDSDQDGTTTPGPNPTPCNKEVLKSQSAIFIKVLDRGDRNCCSRCDLIFKPLPSSALAKKREERAKKQTPSAAQPSSSQSSHPLQRDERPRDKRPNTPPKSASADLQGPSTSSSQPPHGPFAERHTPRPYQDTPALRQLHEYARPHVLSGQDPQRSIAAYGLAGLSGHPHIDPLASYHRLAMYPPGSRERLELELERDKRERDQRERELRERELREMEMREKLKAEMDLKPPGMPASKPGIDRLLPLGATPLDPHWIELQRRFGYPPVGALALPPGAHGAGVGPGHLPGVYPPVSLTSDLVAREREKLERLALPTTHPHLPPEISYASAVERLSAERQHAEKLGLVPPSMPNEALARLQMASFANNAAAAAAAMHAHTHTHAHSHTHLHLHQQQETSSLAAAAALNSIGGAGTGLPAIHPLAHLYPPPVGPPDGQQSEQLSSRMIYQYYSQQLTSDQLVYMQRVTNEFYLRTKQERSLIDPAQLVYQFSRADPMSGLPSASGVPSTLASLHQAAQPLLPASQRDQELLQRELYSRACMDPSFAHQLSAAQHEAFQRQLALERERYGATGHLPH